MVSGSPGISTDKRRKFNPKACPSRLSKSALNQRFGGSWGVPGSPEGVPGGSQGVLAPSGWESGGVLGPSVESLDRLVGVLSPFGGVLGPSGVDPGPVWGVLEGS